MPGNRNLHSSRRRKLADEAQTVPKLLAIHVSGSRTQIGALAAMPANRAFRVLLVWNICKSLIHVPSATAGWRFAPTWPACMEHVQLTDSCSFRDCGAAPP